MPTKKEEAFFKSKSTIKAAEILMLAQANVARVDGIVDAYKLGIFEDHKFAVAPEYAEPDESENYVRGPSMLFMMSEQDHLRYRNLCDAARAKAGLWVKSPGRCPKHEADLLLCKAEKHLLSSMMPSVDLERISGYFAATKERKEAAAICLAMLTPHLETLDIILSKYSNEGEDLSRSLARILYSGDEGA